MYRKIEKNIEKLIWKTFSKINDLSILFEIINYGTIFQKTIGVMPRKFEGAEIPAFVKFFRKAS